MQDMQKLKHDAVNDLVRLKFIFGILCDQTEVAEDSGLTPKELIKQGEKSLEDLKLRWQQLTSLKME